MIKVYWGGTEALDKRWVKGAVDIRSSEDIVRCRDKKAPCGLVHAFSHEAAIERFPALTNNDVTLKPA